MPPTPTPTPAPSSSRRLPEQRHGEVPVDVDALICPVCGDQVQAVPPAVWRLVGLRVAPAFSHHDRTALCRTRSGVLAEPVEARWWPLEMSR